MRVHRYFPNLQQHPPFGISDTTRPSYRAFWVTATEEEVDEHLRPMMSPEAQGAYDRARQCPATVEDERWDGRWSFVVPAEGDPAGRVIFYRNSMWAHLPSTQGVRYVPKSVAYTSKDPDWDGSFYLEGVPFSSLADLSGILETCTSDVFAFETVWRSGDTTRARIRIRLQDEILWASKAPVSVWPLVRWIVTHWYQLSYEVLESGLPDWARRHHLVYASALEKYPTIIFSPTLGDNITVFGAGERRHVLRKEILGGLTDFVEDFFSRVQRRMLPDTLESYRARWEEIRRQPSIPNWDAKEIAKRLVSSWDEDPDDDPIILEDIPTGEGVITLARDARKSAIQTYLPQDCIEYRRWIETRGFSREIVADEGEPRRALQELLTQVSRDAVGAHLVQRVMEGAGLGDHPAAQTMVLIALHAVLPESHRGRVEALIQADLLRKGHDLVDAITGALTESESSHILDGDRSESLRRQRDHEQHTETPEPSPVPL